MKVNVPITHLQQSSTYDKSCFRYTPPLLLPDYIEANLQLMSPLPQILQCISLKDKDYFKK